MNKNKILEIYERLDKLDDIKLKELIKELLEETKELNNELKRDNLTKVYNRRILDENIDYDVLAMCDIDNFKEINDTYGHNVGDEILIEIANKLKSMVRNTDIICRYGGDEFTILFRNCSMEDVMKRMERIKESINNLEVKQNLNISVSVGLSEYEFGKGLNKALKEADKALYNSKDRGKNRVTVYKKIH